MGNGSKHTPAYKMNYTQSFKGQTLKYHMFVVLLCLRSFVRQMVRFGCVVCTVMLLLSQFTGPIVLPPISRQQMSP